MKMMRNWMFILLILVSISGAVAQGNVTIGTQLEGKATYYRTDRKSTHPTTASGENYDMTAMEAGSSKIAHGALVKVTNVNNNRWIIVRINDRVYSNEYTLELTLAAADSLRITTVSTPVQMEVLAFNVPRKTAQTARANAYRTELLSQPGKTNNTTGNISATGGAATPAGGTKPAAATDNKAAGNDAATANKGNTGNKPATNASTAATTKTPTNNATGANAGTGANTGTGAGKTAPASAKTTDVNADRFKPTNTYTVTGEKVNPAGYGVQIGSFETADNALEAAQNVNNLNVGKVFIQSGWSEGKVTYRVLVGTFKDKDDTKDMVETLGKKKYTAFARKHF